MYLALTSNFAPLNYDLIRAELVVEGEVVAAVDDPGVVPDHGAAGEDAVAVGHHRGHVEHEPRPVLVLHQVDSLLRHLGVLGGRIHCVYDYVFSLGFIKVSL